MSTGNLFSISDIPKPKKTKCEDCQCLKQCKQSPQELLVQQFRLKQLK